MCPCLLLVSSRTKQFPVQAWYLYNTELKLTIQDKRPMSFFLPLLHLILHVLKRAMRLG